MSFIKNLKRFDVYREIPADLTGELSQVIAFLSINLFFVEPTVAGASLSIFAIVSIVVLFLSEFVSFLSMETVNTMFVDPESEGQQSSLPINMDISMLALPCSSRLNHIENQLYFESFFYSFICRCVR